MPSQSPKPKVRLFVYGLLKPMYEPPRTSSDVQHDAVKGRLYDLKKDAALVDAHDPSAPWIRGYSMLIDADELEKIDHFEHPEYRRTAVETWAGHKAWTYVYQKPIPESAEQISDWKLLPKHKNRKKLAKHLARVG